MYTQINYNTSSAPIWICTYEFNITTVCKYMHIVLNRRILKWKYLIRHLVSDHHWVSHHLYSGCKLFSCACIDPWYDVSELKRNTLVEYIVFFCSSVFNISEGIAGGKKGTMLLTQAQLFIIILYKHENICICWILPY